jgi:hypothetical protein
VGQFVSEKIHLGINRLSTGFGRSKAMRKFSTKQGAGRIPAVTPPPICCLSGIEGTEGLNFR